MKHDTWLTAIIRANVKAALADSRKFFLLAIFMAINNVLWLGVFGVFFHVTGAVRGWTLSSTAVLFGMGAFSFGVAFTVFGGAWRMIRPLTDGSLDVFLSRPRPVLLSLVFSRIEATALGDILSGIVIIFCFGHLTVLQGFFALGLGVLGATIFVAAAIAISSLVFWADDYHRVIDQMMDTLIAFSTMPLQGLPVPIRILLFTVLPAGFVAFLPADIVRDFSWRKLAAMGTASIILPLLAILIFHRGLRRYTSGNRMVDGR